MAKPAENKLYSIQHYVKIMLFISFSALVLDFAISITSITIVKQQSTRSLQDTADLYINQINKDFNYINHFMGWTLANDENVEIMQKNDINSTKFIKANSDLFKRVVELQKIYGPDYNFFLYFNKLDFMSNFTPMNMKYTEYQSLKNQIIKMVNDRSIYDQYYSNWSTIDLMGTYYVINIVPYHDTYMIGLISADDLILPLHQLNLGENGFASLVDEKGVRITSPISSKGTVVSGDEAHSIVSDFMHTRTTVNADFTNASFYVELIIQFGAFEKIMIAQLLIILLAVIIACNLSFILIYFKKKVLTPIKSFSYNLTFWTGDGEPLDVESSKIFELEKANKQFLTLVTQIKKYKIDIYERELEKQRIQLNFMKLQIKPHFFLNCLTSIYSMAQMQMHEEIEQMSLSTSKYFRYIFQNDQDFVRLEDELEHIRIYLDIQKHRYRDAFVYQIRQSDPSRGVKIPPLVLQTFIENAIKYAVSRETQVQIALTVDRQFMDEQFMTVIRITDTGPGFPQQELEQLAAGQPLDQTSGTHIGITNTVQRLEFLYQNKAIVHFSNTAQGGASVVLWLPDPPAEPLRMEA
ncbi:sensor histidine kinase [Paenibacillus protaetiae]|uniref:Sensor histidine kinase n=2 Tax=Paenibacillus protaetiae TaxID=2509456 RepID=A0A4P6F1Q0_9BACL|nr:histidine kinase [Paenibacillus protaetiae]QAY68593.1 sensor histidine kinase [Paenibacillus protaetiae]